MNALIHTTYTVLPRMYERDLLLEYTFSVNKLIIIEMSKIPRGSGVRNAVTDRIGRICI